MLPNMDIEALSGICGSISIACWVVVFSPQIVENFRRSSAEGLSIVFVVTWLFGDIFNILGAVLQGVLPTMIILAVYYTLADIVLLAQCFYYRGFTLSDVVHKPATEPAPTERSTLLPPSGALLSNTTSPRLSFLSELDGTHFSPATPLHPGRRDEHALKARSPAQKSSVVKAVIFNLTSILVVCAAGVLGWWLSTASTQRTHRGGDDESEAQHESELHFNILGQVFGYICTVLYLGSRIPQLLLNYRRKSTEGISMLFFIFACLGNLTYVMSILFYKPVCHHAEHCRDGEVGSIYGRYFLLNLSWLIGSFGTLFLDGGVFIQYFMYRSNKVGELDSAIVD